MQFETLRDFIYYYYINPVLYDTGYNPVNTLTWAVLLCLFIFGTLSLLRRIGVVVDGDFMAAVVPYIVLGSVLRVIEDTGEITAWYRIILVSPAIYFAVFLVCIISLYVTVRLAELGIIRSYQQAFAGSGALMAVISLTALLWMRSIKYPEVLVQVLAISLLVTAFVYLAGALLRKTSHNLSDFANTVQAAGVGFMKARHSAVIIWSHLFDAASTYIGVDFHAYQPKHVVERFLVESTGTAIGMIPMKLAVIIPVLYIIYRYLMHDDEDIELMNLLLVALLVLGLAPGLRNTLRICLGV